LASREELLARLDRLDTRLRTAFAVACTERALSIYPALGLSRDSRLTVAVELAWRYACGEEVELLDIAEADDGLRAAIPKLDQTSSDVVSYPVCVALSHTLDAIDDPTPDSAADAVGSALETIEMTEDYLGHETREWAVAERDWLLRALAVCESAGDGPAHRGLFQALGSHPPWCGEVL
jgi:hypothetical protein